MIYNSFDWKEELYTCFLDIAEFITHNEEHEKSYIKLEKALMFGAYIIRKLNDSSKIPPSFIHRKESIEMFKNKGENVDSMNWHRIDELYDIEKTIEEECEWIFIINQIIHSYTFGCVGDEHNAPVGILINSDTTKKKSLYFFSFELLLKMFLLVSEGDMNNTSSSRDKDGKMRLIDADYNYPLGFEIGQIIEDTIHGKIYQRPVSDIIL